MSQRPIRLAWICKRRYTNKDLLADRYGRLYHYPVLLEHRGFSSSVFALDYRGHDSLRLTEGQTEFVSIPVGYVHWFRAYRALLGSVCGARPDAVIASGDTHLGWIGLHAARSLGVPFIFDVYDDYRTFGTNRAPGMRRLFGRVTREAGLVLCVSDMLKGRLREFNPRLMLLGNGVDLKLFKPMDKQAARTELGLEQEAPVVGYFGSLQQDWGTFTLMDACRSLQRDFPRLRLLLAGHNNTGRALDEGFVTYLGNVPQSRVPLLINACDVVTMPYHQTEQVDAINPCKLAEYLACGAAIVATRVADLGTTLAACPQGLCAPGDAAGLADALRLQLRAPCRVPFPLDMTWEVQTDGLAGELMRVAGTGWGIHSPSNRA